ncbi:hypothetical protein ACH4TU_19280 [Streptomyces physcomitrii]
MASLVRAVRWERLGKPRKTRICFFLLGFDLDDLGFGGGESGG